MNIAAPAFAKPATQSLVAFTETHPGNWTVTVGGDENDSRAISRDGSGFIAWIGHQSRHWSFQGALDACAEDIRYRQFEALRCQLEHEEAIASLMRMTPAQKSRLIAKLEAERDWLDWSDSEVDVLARKAGFDKQIATLRTVGGM